MANADRSLSYALTARLFISPQRTPSRLHSSNRFVLLCLRPRANVSGAISQLYAYGFARPEEIHHLAINQCHLFEIQHKLVRAARDLRLQLRNVFRFHPADEPENRRVPV